tara:strand:+ start:112 stop:525 length:414 start_codon:yes stop_codon:yes gene_type:complete
MKKSELKTIIRTIVREEVAMSIHEVLTELRQPTQQVSQPKPKRKVVEKKQFVKNSVLNDVLNETAQDDEWKTMGGGTYDSSRVNEIIGSAYGNQKPTGDQMIASMGADPERVPDAIKDAVSRDYSGLMKAIDKKKGK